MTTRISHLPPRRSASAEAAALKLAERDEIDVDAWMPATPVAIDQRREVAITRACAMAQGAALKLEEAAC